MTTDVLDRIDLLLLRVRGENTSNADDALIEILNLVSEELRLLHNRSPQEQLVDYGQELLKEKN